MAQSSLNRTLHHRSGSRARYVAATTAVVPATFLLWWGLGARLDLGAASLVGLLLMIMAFTGILVLVWPGSIAQTEKD